MDIDQIAQICHGAVRSYYAVVGGAMPPRWDRLEQAERDAALAAVNDLASAPGFIPAEDPRERLVQCVAFALCWNAGEQPTQAEPNEEIKGEVGQEFGAQAGNVVTHTDHTAADLAQSLDVPVGKITGGGGDFGGAGASASYDSSPSSNESSSSDSGSSGGDSGGGGSSD